MTFATRPKSRNLVKSTCYVAIRNVFQLIASFATQDLLDFSYLRTVDRKIEDRSTEREKVEEEFRAKGSFSRVCKSDV